MTEITALEVNELKALGIYENKQPLKLENIRVHKKSMKLVIPFETSFGRFDSLIRFYPEITFSTPSGKRVTGLGECSPLSAPWYDYECHRSVETALGYLIGALTGKTIDDQDGLPVAELEPVTTIHSLHARYKWLVGHNIAKCGMEGAYWDAVAKLNGVPVWKLWGGSRKKVETGTSVGLEPTVDALMRKVEKGVDELKVARVKVKVKPGRDIKYIEAIRKRYPGIRLQVDANAAYDLFNPEDLAILKEFDNYNLLLIEQPGSNDDYYDHARQLPHINTPICLDESILNAMHARQAIELWKQYSSTDKLIINIKPPRVGGYLEAIRIAVLASKEGVRTWCGGMHESAIGKTANVHFSSREEVNLPGDHVSQASYFVEDVGEHPKYSEGFIKVPEGEGWGEDFQVLTIY